HPGYLPPSTGTSWQINPRHFPPTTKATTRHRSGYPASCHSTLPKKPLRRWHLSALSTAPLRASLPARRTTQRLLPALAKPPAIPVALGRSHDIGAGAVW